MNLATGWIRDDDAVEEFTNELADEGVAYAADAFSGHADELVGRGVHGQFTHLGEKAITGQLRDSWNQRRGTCVGQGCGRALQDGWYESLRSSQAVGRAVEVAYEPAYAGSRTVIGKGRLKGDGSNGAWIAKWVHKYGVLPRGSYNGIDLTEPREDLAVKWGGRGAKIPKAVLEPGYKIQVRCFRARSADEMSDAAAAGYAGIYCDTKTLGNANADGISRLTVKANHCTEVLGFAVSESGERLIGNQQSWGSRGPQGPNLLTYKGGTQALREGLRFVPLEDFEAGLRRRGAEAWFFQFEEGFR